MNAAEDGAPAPRHAGMTEVEVHALPVTIDLLTSAKALGVSRSEAYILARAGQYPIRIYRVGTRYRVAKADLVAFLGLTAPSE